MSIMWLSILNEVEKQGLCQICETLNEVLNEVFQKVFIFCY